MAATTKDVPPIQRKSPNVMRNPKYAQTVVDSLNDLRNAEVRIGTGPSSMNVAPGKAVIHVSIEEIVKLLKDQGHI